MLAAMTVAPDTDSPADFVAVAERIATVMHKGAKDQAGAPYIDHPRRVAARLRDLGGTDHQVAAAWLHDVVEDTNTNADALLAAGIPADTVEMVMAVTKRDDEPTEEYIQRIVSTPGALRVKRADLADNTDPVRVEALQRLNPSKAERLKAKYADFTAKLGAAAATHAIQQLGEQMTGQAEQAGIAGEEDVADYITQMRRDARAQ